MAPTSVRTPPVSSSRRRITAPAAASAAAPAAAPAPATVSRQSMAVRIREIILERVRSGAYPPGHRLRELELAAEMQTSQGPVREALRELEARRIIVTEPYKGTRVRTAPLREMREAYDVRAVLEQLAGEQAAACLKGHVEPLRTLAREVARAAARGDVEAYAAHDLPMHRQIVEAAGNAVLLRSWDELGFEIHTRLLLSLVEVDLRRAQTAHVPILDALHAGDGRKAGRLLRQHAEEFSALLAAAIAAEDR